MTGARLERWTTAGVCVSAVAVGLVATFLPWFRHVVAVSDSSGNWQLVRTANAWSASSTWTRSALLAILAGAAAVAGYRRRSSSPWSGAPALVLAVAALSLCVWGRHSVVSGSRPPEGGVVGGIVAVESTGAPDPDLFAVRRDRLYLRDEDGYRAEFGVGPPVAIALLLVQSLLAGGAVAAAVRARPPDGAGPVSP